MAKNKIVKSFISYFNYIFIHQDSSTPWRTCCEVRVMLCMTFFFCAPLQSAGGFILEGDWTPTKTNLYYSPPIEVGVSSTFKMNLPKFCKCIRSVMRSAHFVVVISSLQLGMKLRFCHLHRIDISRWLRYRNRKKESRQPIQPDLKTYQQQ